jgi:hypothetical protein
MQLNIEAEISLSSIGDYRDIAPKFGMKKVSPGGDKDSIISSKMKVQYDV